MVKLQEKPLALKREHPALQKMKFIHFFLFLWVIFVLLDPDPDPDPQHREKSRKTQHTDDRQHNACKGKCPSCRRPIPDWVGCSPHTGRFLQNLAS